jgi:hypothetical protein
VGNDLTPQQAQAALVRAAESSRRVRSRASSTRTFAWVSAASWAAAFIAYGMIPSWAIRLPVWLLLLVLPLALVVRWSGRRPAYAVDKPLPEGHRVYAGSLCGLAALTAIVGEAAHLYGRLSFWVPAAIVIALPMVVFGFRVGRR